MLSRFKSHLKNTALGDLIYAQEFVLKKQLRNAGARFPPEVPQKGWLNTTLKSKAQAKEAFEEAVACGLPPHPDVPKNWDALSVLTDLLEHIPRSGNILEVGAPLYSVMLQWLYLFGYRNLQGIDLVFEKKLNRGPIRYEYGDLTQTRFQSQSYDAIVSLSVIEHHVDLDKYFKEMSRLLKPQGRLYTSTDYWEAPVDTRGEHAYGGPIRIFSRAEMEDMFKLAENYRLFPTKQPRLECEEQAVCWERFQLHYTFACFGLEKR